MKLNKNILLIVFVSFALVGGCFDSNSERFSVNPNVPSDIEGGAPDASLFEAALFAWQEFIALNWPADPNLRDTPDENIAFGDTSFEGNLVWETFRHKVEIYPGAGDNPPGFVNDVSQSFGYDASPQYIYGDGEVEPCEGQDAPSVPAFVNLDELTQIGLDFMFAGTAPIESEVNNDPQLIRFLAKANRVHYEYVVDPATSYWEHSDAYMDAIENFKMVSQSNGVTTTLPGPVIDFPDGMIEVKAAFRELTEEEKNSGRFHVTTVRYYEESDSEPNSACYHEGEWGLLGLHIIHKTPTAPYFIFATFEQSDNLLTADGQFVEDVDGNVINPASSSTTPELTYMDGTPPVLDIVGEDYCDEIGNRLYYQEVGPELFGFDSGLPFEGEICQNERTNRIPPAIISANEVAHNAIDLYNQENGLGTTAWQFYKLVNVQHIPFDVTEIDNDPESDKNISTFFLSDIVIETDFSTQSFSGQLFFSDSPAGPPTNFPANFDNFDSSRETFQNVLVFDDEGNLAETYNMGGCMGCHGNGQLSGDDFSFILKKGRVVEGPEATGVTTPGVTNPAPQN